MNNFSTPIKETQAMIKEALTQHSTAPIELGKIEAKEAGELKLVAEQVSDRWGKLKEAAEYVNECLRYAEMLNQALAMASDRGAELTVKTGANEGAPCVCVAYRSLFRLT
jgi:hypothetical protein